MQQLFDCLWAVSCLFLPQLLVANFYNSIVSVIGENCKNANFCSCSWIYLQIDKLWCCYYPITGLLQCVSSSSKPICLHGQEILFQWEVLIHGILQQFDAGLVWFLIHPIQVAYCLWIIQKNIYFKSQKCLGGLSTKWIFWFGSENVTWQKSLGYGIDLLYYRYVK